ncbi:feather keratin 1-like [Pseudopipra pipra]|uniref:feather keratin 1-like n=1 Tax=Pseudopipra pipra TaxID=415032 RepID=UPI003139056D
MWRVRGSSSSTTHAFLPLPSVPGAAPAPDMSCYTPCLPCQPCGPTPLANSCNEPCVRQCQDSNVFIQPSPVVVTLPGPILSSFPQNTAVGSSTSAAVGSILSSQGVPINSGGFGLSGLGSGLCGRSCFPC